MYNCRFIFSLLLFLTFLNHITDSLQAKETRPNILFILTDDQAPETLSCYGNTVCQTPNIDLLAESGMVIDPVTINPENTLKEALVIKNSYNISGIPVVEKKSRKLIGILTNRDIRFAKNLEQPVSALMTKDNLITVNENIKTSEKEKNQKGDKNSTKHVRRD